MKYGGKDILACFVIVVLSILLIFTFHEYKVFKHSDDAYTRIIVDKYKQNTNSVYTISQQLLENWEHVSDKELILGLSYIRAQLNKIELSTQVIAPHYNIRSPHEIISTTSISEIFRLYEREVSLWQDEIMNESSTFNSHKSKDSVKNKLEKLYSDFLIIKNMDDKVFYSYSFEEISEYWKKTINSLELKEVVEAYKKIYE